VIRRVANLGLRGATLVSKFLLLFLLARLLEPEEVGLYGLITVTVAYALYLLGFDFYTFTTREIIHRDRSEWGGLLKNQGAFSALLYAAFLPALSVVFYFGLLPVRLAGWFFLLLVLEHVNQELGRLLVAISRPLTASVLLFLRSGLWAFVIAALMFAWPELRSLSTVLLGWSIGGTAAALLGLISLHYLGLGGWDTKVDWTWIGEGVRVAVPLLIATLAIRGVHTVDRYWFEALVGLDTLAAYVLFMGMSTALMSFLDAGVFAFLYPALIQHWKQGSPANFRESLRRLVIQTAAFTAGFAICAVFALPLLLDWLDRPVYTENADLFVWLMLATVFFAVSMVPHYALYAQGKDKHLIASHLLALPVFGVSTLLFIPLNHLLAVPAGLCFTFAFTLLWKMVAYYKLTPTEYQLFRRPV